MLWLTNLLSSLGGGIVSVVDGWQRRSTARVEADVKVAVTRAEAEATILVARATAATRLAENAQATDAQWDLAANQQMERTWKDEFYVVLFAVPLVLAFVAPDAVQRGFASLDGMPAWYFYSIGTMVAATFGMRRLLSLFEKARR